MVVGEEERETIRRAYYVERKSQRQIAKEEGRSRKTVKRLVGEKADKRKERQGPLVYEPYRARVEAFLEENEGLPQKQRYTASKIYTLIAAQGYSGCESRVRQEVGKWKKEQNQQEVYLPLEFEPSQDAQYELPTAETIATKLNELGYYPKKVAKSQPQKNCPKPMPSLPKSSTSMRRQMPLLTRYGSQ